MQSDKYSSKIETPIYEPKNVMPKISELFNCEKADALIREIERSDLSHDERRFLTMAANRHVTFNYEKTADYYSHASPAIQRLMEDSALVIIDFNRAIELGFVKLTDEIYERYIDEKK